MRHDDEGAGPVTRPSDPDWGRQLNKIPVGEALAGKYRIEGVLGSGGMGTVLRAHHLMLDRSVAIKVMHTELVTMEDAARRFVLEARATAVLKSQHAVRVIDIDRLPTGVPYIVMELLDGQDLATLVQQRGPLSVERAIHYLLQAADAISEAHGHGIIHRDLKPQNLFLTSDGVVKVLDFGLAKALRPLDSVPQSSNTSTNVMVGSPHYMAPEQIWQAASVDQRTDIWGLGATLYHLLAGIPPFPAPNMLVLSSHIASHDPPKISDRRDDVSRTVDDVIGKCMKKKPDDRYKSIASLQGALLHLRVELQTGTAVSSTGSAASTTPGMERPPSTFGGTMPVTTRRDGTVSPQEIATLPPPTTEPLPPPGATDRPPAVWTGDDEPTQISGPSFEPPRKG